MGVVKEITLTDRISVSVRAKNETQANNQKKDTGNNIARALGGTNATDADAISVGTTKKPTITDSNGNEWVSMEDIIAAGKKMKENGAFSGNHSGLDNGSGDKYNLNNVYTFSGNLDIPIPGSSNHLNYHYYPESNASIYMISTGSKVTFFSKESFNTVWSNIRTSDDIDVGNGLSTPIQATTVTINGASYSYFYSTNSTRNVDISASGISNYEEGIPGALYENIAGYLFGPVSSGGSLIDWDAPNAEIERQIKNLHETWDVSEHPGASQSMGGTYVLAGPIEFNNGD